MPLSIEEVNRLKAAPVPSMLPVLATRWSPRSFKNTPISPADLRTILEAARWSQSSSNEQPWRFFVGVKGTETHNKIFATLVPFNQLWATNASVLILSFAQLKNEASKPNKYAMYDLGAATANLVTQAHALGLYGHSMGGFDNDKAKQTFDLSDDFEVGAVTAIGYQDEPAALANETLLEREVAQRQRKPLSEIALTALNEPLKL
jgi:nitroreductase